MGRMPCFSTNSVKSLKHTQSTTPNHRLSLSVGSVYVRVSLNARYHFCFVLSVSCCVDVNSQLYMCIVLIVYY